MKAPVRDGPRIAAIAVYLLVQQLLPQARAAAVCADVLGLLFRKRRWQRCKLARRALNVRSPMKNLDQAPVIHQDESGLYVMGKRWWVHVTSTNTLTHYAAHRSRGAAALEAIAIAPVFQATSMHDAWSTYFQYEYGHALCGVHLLRELTFLAEEHHCAWATELIDLLLRMKNTLSLLVRTRSGWCPPPNWRHCCKRLTTCCMQLIHFIPMPCRLQANEDAPNKVRHAICSIACSLANLRRWLSCWISRFPLTTTWPSAMSAWSKSSKKSLWHLSQ